MLYISITLHPNVRNLYHNETKRCGMDIKIFGSASVTSWARFRWLSKRRGYVSTSHFMRQCDLMLQLFNTLRPRQNGRHFPDDIFKRIFLNENAWILLKISLKFVPKGPINNIPALVQIMAWRRLGDKPLSEAMMVNLSTHICVTRPQWVNCPSIGCSTNGCTKTFCLTNVYTTTTSQWARWRLISPASRLVAQPLVQGADQRKHQSSVSLAFVRGIHRGPASKAENVSIWWRHYVRKHQWLFM